MLKIGRSKPVILGVSILLGAMAADAAPPPQRSRTCTVYEHRDYGGAHRTLGHRDVLRMVNPPALGTSDGVYRYLYAPSWNDQISSFRTAPGCTMTLWEHVNRGGHHLRSNRDRAYVGDGWNDKASDAVCDCEEAGATY
jgi:syncollin